MSTRELQVREVSPGYLDIAGELDVPPGYKRTEAGVIPEEWEGSRVCDIASSARNAIVGGPFGSDLVSKDYVEFGVPVIRGQNMSSQWVSGTFAFVTPAKAKLLEANLARPGDIVFTQRGTLGQVSIVATEPFESYLVSQSQMKLTLNREIADPLFFFYVFTSEEQQGLIRGGTIQTGVPHINLGILREIPIQLPPIPEQRAIAEALSDVDGLLGALEALIAKKQAIKQATMQQLLTGNTRLSGYSGAWETKRLGELAEVVMGQSPSSSNYNRAGKGLPLIQGNADIANRMTLKRIFTTEITKRGKAGDILMSVRAPVGEISVAAFDICLGRGVCAVRYYNDFMYHYLVSAEPTWVRLSKGSTFDSVSSSDVKALVVVMPSDADEQTAIATVLSDMDAEITALEKRRDKARALKQGMMQQLLTGRVRLVESEQAA